VHQAEEERRNGSHSCKAMTRPAMPHRRAA
jgi:hypothetical protein